MTRCASTRKDTFEITKLDYPRYVKSNSGIDISFSITNLNWLFPDKAFVYLYMNNDIVFSASPWINPNTTVSYNETFIPDAPGTYKFHLSVINNEMNETRCEDYKDFNIKVFGEGQVNPIIDPITESVFEYWYIYLAILGSMIILGWRFLK